MDSPPSPRRHIGIYDLNLHGAGAGGGEKETLTLAEHLSETHQVTLLVARLVDWRHLQEFFQLDLSRVRVRILSTPPGYPATTPVAAAQDAVTDKLHHSQISALGFDLFINKTGNSNLTAPTPRSIYTCMFPHRLSQPAQLRSLTHLWAWVKAWQRARLQHKTTRAALGSYSVITANSRYTQAWIRRRWGIDSTVVYSACELVGQAGPKEKWIVNVARFAPREGLRHHKQQDMMIEAFKQLTDLHAAGWQFHLVGSVSSHEETQAAVAELQAAAAGYPIFFHFNAQPGVLHQVYRQSALYWHATGYGLAEEDQPRSQEHFGITTVEAMSAGAAPVVINRGGQRETVQHGDTGFLWNTVEELLGYTRQLANHPEPRQAMSERAVAASAQYSRANYLARMDQAIDQVLNGTGV